MNKVAAFLLFFGVFLTTYVCDGQEISDYYQFKSPDLYTCRGDYTQQFKSKPMRRFRHFSDDTVQPMTFCTVNFDNVQMDTYHSLGLNVSWVVPPTRQMEWLEVDRFHLALTTKEAEPESHSGKSSGSVIGVTDIFKLITPNKSKHVINYNQINRYSWNVCNYVLPGDEFRVEVYGRVEKNGKKTHPLICRRDFTVPGCCTEVGRTVSLCLAHNCDEVDPNQ